jgi:hypothetical protein
VPGLPENPGGLLRLREVRRRLPVRLPGQRLEQVTMRTVAALVLLVPAALLCLLLGSLALSWAVLRGAYAAFFDRGIDAADPQRRAERPRRPRAVGHLLRTDRTGAGARQAAPAARAGHLEASP